MRLLEIFVYNWNLGYKMVKINISIEGEDFEDILSSLVDVGTTIVKSNKKELCEIIELLADESIDILMKPKIIEKGAKLYRKINNEINYQYKLQK